MLKYNMRAKTINEISSILKPKSAEEIHSSLKESPKFQLEFELMKSCMKFWESTGIEFNKTYHIDDLIEWSKTRRNHTGWTFNEWKNKGIDQLIPLFAFPYSKSYKVVNSLQGVQITKTGKISTQRREFDYEIVEIKDLLAKIKTHDVPKLLR